MQMNQPMGLVVCYPYLVVFSFDYDAAGFFKFFSYDFLEDFPSLLGFFAPSSLGFWFVEFTPFNL